MKKSVVQLRCQQERKQKADENKKKRGKRKMFNLIENYKEPKNYYGTISTNSLFMILGTNDEKEVKALCEKLNTEKPAEYFGNKIDWDKVAYFSYDKDVNKELIY